MADEDERQKPSSEEKVGVLVLLPYADEHFPSMAVRLKSGWSFKIFSKTLSGESTSLLCLSSSLFLQCIPLSSQAFVQLAPTSPMIQSSPSNRGIRGHQIHKQFFGVNGLLSFEWNCFHWKAYTVSKLI